MSYGGVSFVLFGICIEILIYLNRFTAILVLNLEEEDTLQGLGMVVRAVVDTAHPLVAGTEAGTVPLLGDLQYVAQLPTCLAMLTGSMGNNRGTVTMVEVLQRQHITDLLLAVILSSSF